MSKADPAIFLDRDGTVIEDPGYLRDCSQVRLLAGAAQAIRQFRQAGFRIVIVTNQSGVARGFFNEIELAAVHTYLRQMLAAQDASIDGLYYCPYHPEGIVEAYRKDSDWRKPGCGMLKAAAQDLGLDLCASWMIGDSLRDVEAGKRAGCRTVLLTAGKSPVEHVQLSPFGRSTPANSAGVAPDVCGHGPDPRPESRVYRACPERSEGTVAPGTQDADFVVADLLEASRRILDTCSSGSGASRMHDYGH